MTTRLATTTQHIAPIFGLHALAKTVRLRPVPAVGLICSFHGCASNPVFSFLDKGYCTRWGKVYFSMTMITFYSPPQENEETLIVPMRIEHLPDVLAIERLSFKTPWSYESFLNDVKNPGTDYRIAKVGERLVGYAGLWLVVDEAHITNIAVHPDFRGRKIGEKLLLCLLEVAHTRGMARALLEARVGNTPALHLYQKYGFKEITRRRNYYQEDQEDAIVMWADGVNTPEYGERLARLKVQLLEASHGAGNRDQLR